MQTDERLAAIEAILARVEKRLFGNGQPGEIERLDRRVDTVEEEHGSRLTVLEQWKWHMAGAIAVFIMAIQLVAQHIPFLKK